MESQIKSSFIPRDAAAPSSARRSSASPGGAFDIFVLGAVVLLFASLALGVGVFLYHQFLQTSIANKQEQLERARAAFEPQLIAELTRLDQRMTEGQRLLSSHVAPSEFFSILEDLTLQTVAFSGLSFEAPEQGSLSISMEGIAHSVNSIALQADLFGRHPAIASPIFSNIRRETDGVRFNVEAIINPAALRYGTVLQSRGAAAPAQQETASESDEDDGSIPLFAP